MKRKHKVLVAIGAGIALLMIYLRVPGGKLWNRFQEDVARSLAETQAAEIGVISEEQVSKLPEALQRYFEVCGYIGTPMIHNASITFREVPFSLSPDKDPMTISYQQYNTLQRPDRIAFINGVMYGIPFQGMDYYASGEGYFTGVLAKHIEVAHSSGTGEDVSRAFLVTFLADSILMPSIFLADYVTCTEVDPDTVKVEISFYGVQAEGLLRFNETGEITAFTCEDRLYDDGRGVSFPARWTIEVADYRLDPSLGVRRPHSAKVFWELPEGDYVYFSSDNIAIAYNVEQPAEKMVRP